MSAERTNERASEAASWSQSVLGAPLSAAEMRRTASPITGEPAPLAEAGYKGRLSLNLAPQLTAEEALSALQRFQSAEGTRRKQVRNVNPFGVASRLWAAVACGGSDEAVADGACK